MWEGKVFPEQNALLLHAAMQAERKRISDLQDRTLRLWNPHRGVHIKTYAGHGYDVRDVCVSADNSK